MRKLLYFSSICLFFACHTSGESVSGNKNDQTDSLVNPIDSSTVNIKIDSTRAIIHGSQQQEKLDSIKRAKQKKKETK